MAQQGTAWLSRVLRGSFGSALAWLYGSPESRVQIPARHLREAFFPFEQKAMKKKERGHGEWFMNESTWIFLVILFLY
jgi:hypothetical protein